MSAIAAMKRTRKRHTYHSDFRALKGQDPTHTHFCDCGFTGTRDDCDAHLLMKLYEAATAGWTPPGTADAK